MISSSKQDALKQVTERYGIYVILIIAAILRFWNFSEIPFTHDEFSALYRTRFDSFSDLIKLGVLGDGHPAGVQVFLWYYVSLFGQSVIAVKLPFLLMGLAAVWVTWYLGKSWGNSTAGLYAAAILAVTQYGIMYSQMARPYAVGLFFSPVLVLFWSRILFLDKSPRLSSYAGFVISGVVLAYTHYFSMFFAGIVGLTGLMFLNKRTYLWYMVSGGMIGLLYLPHLSVFKHHLNVGGVESWLAKPEDSFIVEYFRWIFHYSILFLGLFIVVIVWSIMGVFIKNEDYASPSQVGNEISNNPGQFDKSEQSLSRSQKVIVNISALVWFFLLFLTGFYYSRLGNAVLQFSVLIFAFPTLLLALFAGLGSRRVILNMVMLTLILILGCGSLIGSRHYYRIFYKSVYSEIPKELAALDEQTLKLFDGHRVILRQLNKMESLDTAFVMVDELKVPYSLDSILRLGSIPAVGYGALSQTNPVIWPMIYSEYPVVEKKIDYFGGTYWLFKHEGVSDSTAKPYEVHTLNWVKPEGRVDVAIGGLSQPWFWMGRDNEYGPGFTDTLKGKLKSKFDFIDAVAEIAVVDTLEGVILVASLESDGKAVAWQGSGANDFYIKKSVVSDSVSIDQNVSVSDGYVRLAVSIKLSDLNEIPENSLLKVFLWNKGKRVIPIRRMEWWLRPGNREVYSLFTNFQALK